MAETPNRNGCLHGPAGAKAPRSGSDPQTVRILHSLKLLLHLHPLRV
jgi:hypothetical protein